MTTTEKLFIEATRTGLITITAGCETTTVETAGELYSLIRLLRLPKYDDQGDELSIEFKRAYIDAIFEKKQDHFSDYDV